MTVKLIGAILIFLGCGGFGFAVASAYRREVGTLRNLLRAVDYMQFEMQYRQLPLPELCRRASAVCNGSAHTVLNQIADELDKQVLPDVNTCVQSVINSRKGLSTRTLQFWSDWGASLGNFDVQTQLKALGSLRQECNMELDKLQRNQDDRMWCYQVLGVCAGAAVAILLV